MMCSFGISISWQVYAIRYTGYSTHCLFAIYLILELLWTEYSNYFDQNDKQNDMFY